MSTLKERLQYFPELTTADKDRSLPVLNLVPRSRDKSKSKKKNKKNKKSSRIIRIATAIAIEVLFYLIPC